MVKNKLCIIFCDARKFEVAKGFEDKNIKLPLRATAHSAGYDFFSIDNVDIKPGEMILLHTGVKAYMQPNEFLQLVLRSSVGIKKKLMLINSVAIIDADYYNNQKNDGEILLPLLNVGHELQHIKKGERIVQGIFLQYLTCGDLPHEIRHGGVGSTSE